MSVSGDRARVTVFVAVPQKLAFEVFTREIDLWWKRGPKFRHSGKQVGKLTFEEGVGGRLFEAFTVGREERLIEVGRVVGWEPPERLCFEWRNATFAPVEHTQVEVLFEAAGDGTRVTVTHRGWAAIRPDHPARHGQPVPAFIAELGTWWGAQLSVYRLRCKFRA